MMTDFHFDLDSDWNTLLSFLPKGWKEQAKPLGALERNRNFANPAVLLRVLLLHLSCGHSLRTTAALAKESKLASVSDVAVLKRLNASGEWFLWMAQEMRKEWFPAMSGGSRIEGYNMRLVDCTTVEEPGATGTTWKIHYAFSLDGMRCDDVHVTSPKVSECFTNFAIRRNDIVFGDRGYCKTKGVAHVVDHGGHVVLRLISHTPLYDSSGVRVDLLSRLNRLSEGKCGEWDVYIRKGERMIPCRVCALKKSRAEEEKTRKTILRKASRNGRKPRKETLEFAKFVVVLTTLDASFDCKEILKLYRMRWQIELAFKRLKSLLGLGHLRKTDPEGAKAWIHGKLFLAVLIESFIRAGESFSPWGYPLMDEVAEYMA